MNASKLECSKIPSQTTPVTLPKMKKSTTCAWKRTEQMAVTVVHIGLMKNTPEKKSGLLSIISRASGLNNPLTCTSESVNQIMEDIMETILIRQRIMTAPWIEMADMVDSERTTKVLEIINI